MNKLLALIPSLLLAAVLHAQVPVTDLERTDKGWKRKGDSSLFSGDFIEYFENGKVKGTGRLHAGLLNGMRVTYDENGNRSSEKTYVNGTVHGLSKEYHANGKVSQQGVFEKGKEHGEWKTYHENGKLNMLIHFKHGVRDGLYEEFDEQGNLVHRYIFEGNRPGFGKEVEELLREAMRKDNEGKFTESEAMYTKVLELNPTISQAWYGRGTCRLNALALKDAAEDYTRAIQLDSTFKEAWAKRGEVSIHLLTTKNIEPTPGLTKNACADFRKAQELGDNSEGTKEMVRLYCR